MNSYWTHSSDRLRWHKEKKTILISAYHLLLQLKVFELLMGMCDDNDFGAVLQMEFSASHLWLYQTFRSYDFHFIILHICDINGVQNQNNSI